MTKHILKADIRKIIGRRVNSLRRQGLIPANVFGKDIKSTSLQINAADFTKLYKEVGESTLIYLDDRPVMVHETAVHPVTGQILHVDFHQVNLKEKTTAMVTIKLVGESPAEKGKAGILVQHTNEVEIEALPADMPESIEVSVESLAAVGDSIFIKDIKISAKLTIKASSEAIIAKIEPLAKEEPKEAPVEAVAPATVEEEAAPQAPIPATEPPSQKA